MPASAALSIRARLMEAGGPPLWQRFMEELRQEHLGGGLGPGPSVRAELEAAYRQAAAGQAEG